MRDTSTKTSSTLLLALLALATPTLPQTAAREADTIETSSFTETTTETTSPPPLVVERTEVRTLASRHVGVTYKLYVSLPHGYAGGEGRFPVVYTLDADYSFLVARNVTDHLSERADLAEVIVVGIAYDGPLQYRLNRTRDYTPTHVPTGGYGPEYQKVSGGGAQFRSFLAEELIPFVDAAYRTLPGDRTLVGHSYGGLFVTDTLFSTPELFQRYVAVSPSLWYDDHLMLRREEAYAAHHDALPARVYFCVGSREHSSRGSMITDLEQLLAQIRRRGYEGLAVDSYVFPDETHNSVYPAGLTKGLRFVLEGR